MVATATAIQVSDLALRTSPLQWALTLGGQHHLVFGQPIHSTNELDETIYVAREDGCACRSI